MRRFVGLISILFLSLSAFAQNNLIQWSLSEMQRIQDREQWVDSVYASLTLDEKIAQFYMVAAYSNKDEAHYKEIDKLVRDTKVGGLIFMQGNPDKQAELTNRYQALAKVKLLISIDGEWGLQMRLKDSTIAFPHQMTLGAMANDSLIYLMGREIGRQCKRLGIHVNFAPDVDVNNNPYNPVIGDRSFGEDKKRVASKGVAYSNGMQDEGTMACAKHFPGHGDTDSDSHLTLPIIKHDRKRLDSLELYPFRVLIDNDVQSVMAAHLSVPSLDNTKNLATSLSKKVLQDLLRKDMGFEGLVFSDALNMKGVADYYKQGELAVNAFIAGNDILLFADDVPASIKLFKDAIKKGDVDTVDMGKRLRKILVAKYNAGLNNFQPIVRENLYNDLNNTLAKTIRRQLYEQSLTLVANQGNFLPIKVVDTLSMATLEIGLETESDMQRMFSMYGNFEHHQTRKDIDSLSFAKLAKKLAVYETVIVGLHDMSKSSSKGYGITKNSIDFLKNLQTKTKVVVVVFGSPYSLVKLEGLKHVLVAYEDTKDTREVSAEGIMGALPITGTLPVTASKTYPVGKGLKVASLGRLKYTLPEEVGIRSSELGMIDSIMLQAIKDSATPGGQVLVAKNGKVIYYKSFGHHTYDVKKLPVQNSDVYDIASITKIAATTPAIMYLYDKKLFDLDKTIADYVPGLADTNTIRNAKMSDVLTHHAGLRPFLPFYRQTLTDSIYSVCYRNEADSAYCIEVRKDLFLRADYRDTIFHGIYNDPIDTTRGYTYSDLGFYLLKEIAESLTRDSFHHFVDSVFYRPMGMTTMGYHPTRRFPLTRIPPTENDTAFRRTLVHGYVHDQGAAMLGGVSGHAGVFSNANDVAILMQMLLNKGNYAGKQYLDPKTVELFTAQWNPRSRRGLGFDKPETIPGKAGPTSTQASLGTFGHQGFTGTCVWADPEHDLVYVFLSNRIYPSADNPKLGSTSVRTRIQNVIYDAIKKGQVTAVN